MTIEHHDSGEILSRAVVHGDTVYLCGLTPTDRELDVAGQTEEVLAKIDDRLAKCGSDKSLLLSALTDVVRAAGGRLISLRSTENLADAYATILNEMRSRYLLVYEPGSIEPGWHSLDVTLRRKKGEVRARTGYVLRE